MRNKQSPFSRFWDIFIWLKHSRRSCLRCYFLWKKRKGNLSFEFRTFSLCLSSRTWSLCTVRCWACLLRCDCLLFLRLLNKSLSLSRELSNSRVLFLFNVIFLLRLLWILLWNFVRHLQDWLINELCFLETLILLDLLFRQLDLWLVLCDIWERW